MKSLFTIFIILLSFICFAQQDTTLAPFKRYSTVPNLQLVSLDSVSYTKVNMPNGKPVLLMLFSPDCDHCQHEAEQIAANKDEFKNIHIVFASTYPLYRIKAFAEKYGLLEMENVVVTKDPYYRLIPFYGVRQFPYMALYNKKGNLIKTFEGSAGIQKVIQAFSDSK